MCQRFRPFLLSLLFGPLLWAVACTPSKDSDWDEIKVWVAESFPEVQRTTVAELHERLQGGEAVVLLDARELSEFEVSHLRGAQLATDEAMALERLGTLPRETPIVVYCSVGYRSGDLASKLAQRGFSSVENLEGSIFEWANQGLPLEANGEETDLVHPYDEEWGRLLDAERRADID